MECENGSVQVTIQRCVRDLWFFLDNERGFNHRIWASL